MEMSAAKRPFGQRAPPCLPAACPLPLPPHRAPGTGFVCFVTCLVFAALSLPPLRWSLISSGESDQRVGQLLQSPRALGPRCPEQGMVLLCGLGSCESVSPSVV